MFKQIDKKTPLAKYSQISDSIREKIKSGSYAQKEKLPTCRNLASYFGTTVNTVMKAVDVLESEGYVYKVQGKGIFARQPSRRQPRKAKLKRVCLHTPIKTHLYQNITDVLVNKLHNFDYEMVPLGNILGSSMSIEEKETSLRKIVERDFEAVVINGERHFNYKLLNKYKGQLSQIIFIAHYESALDFSDANIITADYEKAGFLGAEYLIQKGMKKILFISYEILQPQQYKNFGTKINSSDIDVLNGIKAAVKKKKLDIEVKILRDTIASNNSHEVTAYLGKNLVKGGLGIMTMGDSRALDAYHTARRMGIEIGKDCSIVGMYNTPWTDILTPKLSSISIREREIGELAAEAVIKGWKGKKILIDPKLIIRET